MGNLASSTLKAANGAGRLDRLLYARDGFARTPREIMPRCERRVQELSLLRRTADALREGFDLEEIFRRFLAIVRDELGNTACSLYLAEETGELVLRARCVHDEPVEVLRPGHPEACRVSPGDGPLGRSFVSGEASLVTEVAPGASGWFPADGRTVFIVPLGPRQGCVGALVLHTRCREDLPVEAPWLLPMLGSQAAVIIENAALYRRLKHHSDTLEARVRERTAALQAAGRQKAQDFARFSHELRTPLTSILGFSGMLEAEIKGPLTEGQRRYVQYVQDCGSRLLRLIDDILDLAKAEAGKLNIDPRPVPLAPLVQQALGAMQPQTQAKHLEMGAVIPAELPMVMADSSRAHQILLNLLSNAIKFTPDGGRITVTARRISDSESQIANRTSQQGGFVEIAVADTGMGIAEADQIKLFQDFSQVAEGCAQGTGLGLSLARSLVELQGGRIGVASARDQGSTFWFTLPAADTPAQSEGSAHGNHGG